MRRCPRCRHPFYPTDRFCLSCGRRLARRSWPWGWFGAGSLVLVGGLGVLLSGLTGALAAPPAVARVAGSAVPPLATPAPPCRFVRGFATLHDLLPTVVGQCLDDEHVDPASHDIIQHTARGLLVWQPSDNVASFTDGYHTWLLGPDGLQERLNSQRLPWERGG